MLTYAPVSNPSSDILQSYKGLYFNSIEFPFLNLKSKCNLPFYHNKMNPKVFTIMHFCITIFHDALAWPIQRYLWHVIKELKKKVRKNFKINFLHIIERATFGNSIF